MESTEDKELEPLKTAVMSALESDGTLNEIRAHLRANVFRVCDNSYDKHKNNSKRVQTNEENLLINQLIRQYLQRNGYKHSVNVFECESGQQKDSDCDPLSLQNKFKLDSKDEDINKLPLLTTIIKEFLERKTNH